MTDLKDDKGKPDFTLLLPEVFRALLSAQLWPAWDAALAGNHLTGLVALGLAHPRGTLDLCGRRCAAIEAALRGLLDEQNGMPLLRRKQEWEEAVSAARKALEGKP